MKRLLTLTSRLCECMGKEEKKTTALKLIIRVIIVRRKSCEYYINKQRHELCMHGFCLFVCFFVPSRVFFIANFFIYLYSNEHLWYSTCSSLLRSLEIYISTGIIVTKLYK